MNIWFQPGSIRLLSTAALAVAALAMQVTGQVTSRVSVDSSGAQGNSNSNYWSGISANGRFVAFQSSASNLIPGDTNGSDDIIVRDRQSGTTERVSVDSSGAQGNNNSSNPSLSADGRFVAFVSYATNLVAGDTNGAEDVFVHDRQLGTTERISVDSGGMQGNGDSYNCAISADGRYVALESYASNLASGDTNGKVDVFVRDRQSGTTERVSVDSGGAQSDGDSYSPAVSDDGRFVVFASWATGLVPGDSNGFSDIFVHDRQTGATERVSIDSGGAQADDNSEYYPSISADGRVVAFWSLATNLVPLDTNGSADVFVHDRQTGTTERTSVDSSGAQGWFDSYEPSISADGRFVAFWSYAPNLVSGDANGAEDVFLHDRQLGTTELMSVDSNGVQGNFGSGYAGPSLSADGRFVAFASVASNLVSGDTNGASDIFVHDRLGPTAFTSLCDPGSAGVIACPCANPPVGAQRGCDNSSATGGASLSASGASSLAFDSLVFTVLDEKPSATSIVLQATAEVPGGLVLGQGVRCVGGLFKRLYVKTASGGSIVAPTGGDPSVSARSAALGDTILSGQSRWYLVYYRDPIALGGCPATSTYNATQTGRVDWSQ